jgi:hypothetical protein
MTMPMMDRWVEVPGNPALWDPLYAEWVVVPIPNWPQYLLRGRLATVRETEDPDRSCLLLVDSQQVYEPYTLTDIHPPDDEEDAPSHD